MKLFEQPPAHSGVPWLPLPKKAWAPQRGRIDPKISRKEFPKIRGTKYGLEITGCPISASHHFSKPYMGSGVLWLPGQEPLVRTGSEHGGRAPRARGRTLPRSGPWLWRDPGRRTSSLRWIYLHQHTYTNIYIHIRS